MLEFFFFFGFFFFGGGGVGGDKINTYARSDRLVKLVDTSFNLSDLLQRRDCINLIVT